MNPLLKNWNCSGSHCIAPNGEVRVLPTGGDGNEILCQRCFNHEIQYRIDRNRTLSDDNKFKLPKWEDLEIYK